LEKLVRCEYRSLQVLDHICKVKSVTPLILAGPETNCKRCLIEQLGAGLNEEPHDKWRRFKHADATVLTPERGSISVDKIRNFCRQEARKSFTSKFKLMIILQAHSMTMEAENALLKTLEEPSPDTLIVLTAPSRSSLSDTIVSRCLVIDVPSLSPEAMFQVLNKRIPLDTVATLTHYGKLEVADPIAEADRLGAVESRIFTVLNNLRGSTLSNLRAQFESADSSECISAVTRWMRQMDHYGLESSLAVDRARRAASTNANREILAAGFAAELRQALLKELPKS
jgi:DNA polymerase-3 subunit delta'